MKKTKVRKHKRKLKWRTTTVKRHKRRRKKKRRIKKQGFWSKKEDEWQDIDDPDYVTRSKINDPNYPKYGKVTKISGRKVGAGVAASGAIPGVPFFLTPVAGKKISDKLDNIKIQHPDETGGWDVIWEGKK